MPGIPARGLPHTVTVLTPGRVANRYGNEAPDWTAATSRTIAAYVQTPGRSSGGSENFDLRDALIGDRQMYTNDMAVTGYDRVIFNGITFEVLGPAGQWDNPAGPHHSEIRLRYVEG